MAANLNAPLVYFATSHDYFGRRHFYQGFAEEFAHRRDTYFVSAARVGLRTRGVARDVAPGLTVVTPVIPKGFSRPALRRWRDSLIARQVAAVVSEETDVTNTVVLGQTTDMLAYVQQAKPKQSVYFACDEVVDPIERELLQAVETVIAGSPIAFKRYESHPRVVEVPAGVEQASYIAAATRRSAPAELQAIPRPIFGYAGSVTTHRLDIEILCTLADNRAGSVVLVGPILGDERRIEPLQRRKNIFILGHREEAVAPDYVAAFDVGLIPYALTPFNLGSNPIKFYEYLAAGLPVVSTRLPSLEPFSSVVMIADSPEEFAAAASSAASAQHDAAAVNERQEFASRFSMSALVDRVEAIIGS